MRGLQVARCRAEQQAGADCRRSTRDVAAFVLRERLEVAVQLLLVSLGEQVVCNARFYTPVGLYLLQNLFFLRNSLAVRRP